jgi:hypothetical protein
MAARRFNRSYFGRKPNGEIDGGGYFVEEIPVRFGLLFDAQMRCVKWVVRGRQSRGCAGRRVRARAAFFAAIAAAIVFFGVVAVRIAARFTFLFHRCFAAIRTLSAGKSGGRRHRSEGEDQQERERYGCKDAQHLFETNAKIAPFAL